MGVIIPEGFAQVKLRWQINSTGEEVISTFGVHPASGHTAQEICDDIFDLLTPINLMLYHDLISTQYSVAGVDATLMTSTGPVGAEHTEVIAGTAGGTPSVSQVSILVKKTTARGGRHGRGRMFLPACFCPEANIDEVGQIQSSNRGTLTAMLEGTLAVLGTSDYPMVLLHSDSTSPDPVTHLNLDPIVATQRRRLRR